MMINIKNQITKELRKISKNYFENQLQIIEIKIGFAKSETTLLKDKKTKKNYLSSRIVFSLKEKIFSKQIIKIDEVLKSGRLRMHLSWCLEREKIMDTYFIEELLLERDQPLIYAVNRKKAIDMFLSHNNSLRTYVSANLSIIWLKGSLFSKKIFVKHRNDFFKGKFFSRYHNDYDIWADFLYCYTSGTGNTTLKIYTKNGKIASAYLCQKKTEDNSWVSSHSRRKMIFWKQL